MGFLVEPITIQSIFGKKRKIGAITVHVILNESATDTLTITKQPVQQGASLTDHSYMEPTVLTMTALFRDNILVSLNKIYDDLQSLQKSREPFDVTTPKRIYRNVLFATLTQTTDKATENCLSISASFQEVIIVDVTTTQVPRIRQRNPAETGATAQAGRKSALLSLKEGIGGLFAR